MSFKDLFKNKKQLKLSVDDFNNYNYIRLYYIALEKFQRGGDILTTRIGQTFGISSPFKIPEGMSMKDACKVISYLSVMVENKYNIEPATEKSVTMVSKILADYGFEEICGYGQTHIHTVLALDYPFSRIPTKIEQSCSKIDGVADLFTINADFKLFEKTDLHNRYFEWFTDGVTKQDVEKIYKNISKGNSLPIAENSNDELSL